MRILFASSNRGKLLELKTVLGAGGIEVVSPDDVLPQGVSLPDVDEDSPTYEGNALKKARSAAQTVRSVGLSVAVLADDSGLEVEALGGAPGVHSARFGGPNASAQENRAMLKRRLLEAMSPESTPQSSARFVCVLAMIDSKGREIITRGSLEGVVRLEEKGSGGFGYDPMIVPSGFTATLAELKASGVFVNTHRERAAAALLRELE